ncbi:MAG: Ada metal-binding domain-containing protein, partial [Novosphingobium sp.]
MTMTMRPLDDEACWQAVLARDRGSDARFVTCVVTTGIYCRPSCPARTPRRENVWFASDAAAAEAAGFRACQRCRPDAVARDEAAVRQALQMLDDAEAPVPLGRLAEATGFSPSHFQRIFRRATGLSPAAYARALRLDRARDALSAGAPVTDAILDAGYAAPSRFYAESKDRLGMAPSAWANGGRGVRIHWAVVATTLGPMLVAATDKGVCRLSFNEGVDALRQRFPHAELVEGGSDFADLLGQV